MTTTNCEYDKYMKHCFFRLTSKKNNKKMGKIISKDGATQEIHIW
jgi:hypothetical protein